MKTFAMFLIIVILVLCMQPIIVSLNTYRPQKMYIEVNPLDWLQGSCGTGQWTDRKDDKTWVTCGKFQNGCYLETLYLKIQPANRIIINLKMKTVPCAYQNKTYPQCRDNITMEINTAKTDDELRKWGNIQQFPGVVSTNKTIDSFIHEDTVTLDEMGKYDGMRLRFQTNMYCGTILNTEIYYFICPQATSDLVVFPKSSAPDFKENSKKLNGNCTANAKPENPDKIAFMTCDYLGNYSPSGRCICDEGYTKDGTDCKECPAGEYKVTIGNDACSKCGKNVKIGAAPRLTCDCLPNYYRALGVTDIEKDCYAPPEKTKSTISNIQAHEVTISWTNPDSGSAPLGPWILSCTNCLSYNTDFPIRTNDTRVVLKNLGAYATYELLLRNDNNITRLIGFEKTNKEVIGPFTTKEGAPGPIVCNYKTNSDGSVTFTWNEPFAPGGQNPEFIVKYGDKELRIQEKTFTIETDLQDKTYTVKIKVEVTANGRIMTGPECTNTVKVKGGIPLSLALGVAFGIVIFIVIVLVASFCVWKKRNPAYLQVVRMEDGSVKLPARFYTGGKIYVDPKSYVDVDEAVTEFAFEIERHDLKLLEKIGEGEFADVFKGELNRGGKKATVAAKVLKPGSTKIDRDDFLSEAAIVGQFSDPNVIVLEGVILKDEPNTIILEYMQNGSLDQFLQENDMQFTVLELLSMARGVASGMKYLSEMGFIHRDLAARNILINGDKICKIADFGMSLEIKMDDGVESKSGKIPVRWTAPEAIQFKKFTTASDVWSYGIVLWEIMSYGERPYWEWTNYEVLEQVTRGYRLPPPMGCPRVVHDLMLHCWNKERTKRPLFSLIRDRIDAWLHNPDLLEEVAVLMKLDENLDYTIMQTINKWLQAISMGRYATNFIEQGFATPRQILLLTIEDLEALGIGNVEHQKRIHKAIENTRAQVEAQMSRSGSVISNKNKKDFLPDNI